MQELEKKKLVQGLWENSLEMALAMAGGVLEIGEEKKLQALWYHIKNEKTTTQLKNLSGWMVNLIHI